MNNIATVGGMVNDGVAVPAKFSPPWNADCLGQGAQGFAAPRFHVSDGAAPGQRKFVLELTTGDSTFPTQRVELLVQVLAAGSSSPFELIVPELGTPEVSEINPRVLVPVTVNRLSYQGEIHLEAIPVEWFLAPGVGYFDVNPVPAGGSATLLVIDNPLHAGEPINGQLPTTVVVRAVAGSVEHTRLVTVQR